LSVVAVPVVRPRASRKTVVLPDLVALPIVLPELSRNVCIFCACAVSVIRSNAAIPVTKARDSYRAPIRRGMYCNHPLACARCSLQLIDISPGGQMYFPPRARHLLQTVAADQVHQCTPVLGARP